MRGCTGALYCCLCITPARDKPASRVGRIPRPSLSVSGGVCVMRSPSILGVRAVIAWLPHTANRTVTCCDTFTCDTPARRAWIQTRDNCSRRAVQIACKCALRPRTLVSKYGLQYKKHLRPTPSIPSLSPSLSLAPSPTIDSKPIQPKFSLVRGRTQKCKNCSRSASAKPLPGLSCLVLGQLLQPKTSEPSPSQT